MHFIKPAFLTISFLVICVNTYGYLYNPYILWSLVFFGPLMIIGFMDMFQKRQTIRRNFPLAGNLRYVFEAIRPEINQYFVESNTEGTPFSREQRSVVYQRSKGALDTLPFGTQVDVYKPGYEWINHSMAPVANHAEDMKVTIGGPHCQKPYLASIYNISAMSYGALSRTAVMSLNQGAKLGGFAHNTGEGGISPYHKEHGGDLIWQIGTGYFGARNSQGRFCEEAFKKNALLDQVKMIELKLSQGAKPGHGGILPAAKVTEEIAAIRGVEPYKDVNSPPGHNEFSTPVGLVEFVDKLRTLSGGKPVGIKFCVGKRREFISLCKAMVQLGKAPDYIAVDGGEGGTGAAPLEFSNSIGSPGIDGLIFVHNCLKGFGLRNNIRVIYSGKINTGFGIIKAISLGADAIYAARSFMLALGCIQALRCNSNICPAGIATQNPGLYKGIDVPTKSKRVAAFHEETIDSMAHMLGAMGLSKVTELRPWHIMKRLTSSVTKHYGEMYEFISEGALLAPDHELPASYKRAVMAARADTFTHVELL
jgi:glutamate synthase domain-containing protein 2